MPYYYHKGWTYHEMGKFQKAIAAFSKGLETQPTYFYAYWRRGLSYEGLGDIENAQRDYRKGYEVGIEDLGEEFFDYMDIYPEVEKKLVQDWDS